MGKQMKRILLMLGITLSFAACKDRNSSSSAVKAYPDYPTFCNLYPKGTVLQPLSDSEVIQRNSKDDKTGLYTADLVQKQAPASQRKYMRVEGIPASRVDTKISKSTKFTYENCTIEDPLNPIYGNRRIFWTLNVKSDIPGAKLVVFSDTLETPEETLEQARRQILEFMTVTPK